MRAVVLAVVVVLAGVGAASLLRMRARGLATVRSPHPAEFQNHLDMARLIERLMENDFVRGVIPEHEQRTARRVLQEFYGDTDPKEIR